jgi:hypothetical protein
MDSILKSRYDLYRARNTFPPEAEILLGEGLKPFSDLALLNDWREKYTTLRVVNEPEGYLLQGKIDDVLVEADGRLVPADYKSSGNPPGASKQKYYIDQLSAYGLMFRHKGYAVSDRAFLFHYFPKDKTDPSATVAFDCVVDRVLINTEGLEAKLRDMVTLLEAPYPGTNPGCENCTYFAGRMEKLAAGKAGIA